ncbi:MAG: DinB family protein [Flavisolibacter sp.]
MIQQTPWIQRQFNFNFPVGLFPVIFSRLEGSIFRIHTILLNADEEKSSHNSAGWSVKQHVGHLYDLEELWWKRLADFEANKAMLTVADMSNAKTNEAGHNEKTLEQLLHLFTVERQKMLETIYSIDEEMLQRTSVHPRLNQPMRLIDALYFIAEHDDHHIAVVSNLLRKS